MRRRLPAERDGVTHKFKIGDSKGYVTVGFFEDGSVGEVFVKMDRQGGTVSGFADAWAITVSMLLQTGTPLQDICEKFRGMSFEPAGVTDNPEIRLARSPVDYLARWLASRFLGQEQEETTLLYPTRAPEDWYEETQPGVHVPDPMDAEVCKNCGSEERLYIAVKNGKHAKYCFACAWKPTDRAQAP
jgi:ribonucleoside-diphosphate reductase alpha chain